LNDINNLIGNTPFIKLGEKLYAKLETYNPSGSIKDRMASYILSKALERGDLQGKDTIVVASSGNTGIAFSMLSAAHSLDCVVIMPCNMSEERKQMMRAYGATIVEVGPSAFKDAISLRDKMLEENSNYWSPKQFSNPDNIECHRRTTAVEIAQSVLEIPARLSALVSGAGTGGTIMGCQSYFPRLWKETKMLLTTPAEDAATHGIQGINDGADFLVDKNLIDEELLVSTEDAKQRASQLAKENGLLVGISSGANVLAAERWIEKNNPTGVVVTFLCDRGERYLS
jgi:cysteine synthase A|tara:strand:- start:393 stop:1247 length:855 start_codon:yes stop_codon:yes gene_type:complete